MATNLRILFSVLFLQLLITTNCHGAATKENVDQHSNVIKLAFGLNLDLNTLNETTFRSIHTVPQTFNEESFLEDTYHSRQATPKEPVDICTGITGRFCTDCFNFHLCNQEAEPIFKASCPSDTPYCLDGTCYETPSTEKCSAATPTSAYKCTATGYIPDPVDCQKYYFCDRDATTLKYTQTTYRCPAGFAFNSATNGCRRTLARCKTFTCGADGIATYSQNKAYYGVCRGNVPTSNMVIFTCPDTTNQVYNPKTLLCDYRCTREGYFPNLVDDTKYYFCYRESRAFKSRQESCPTGYIFKRNQCQAKSQAEKKIDELLAKVQELLEAKNPAPETGNLTPEQQADFDAAVKCLPMKTTLAQMAAEWKHVNDGGQGGGKIDTIEFADCVPTTMTPEIVLELLSLTTLAEKLTPRQQAERCLDGSDTLEAMGAEWYLVNNGGVGGGIIDTEAFERCVKTTMSPADLQELLALFAQMKPPAGKLTPQQQADFDAANECLKKQGTTVTLAQMAAEWKTVSDGGQGDASIDTMKFAGCVPTLTADKLLELLALSAP